MGYYIRISKVEESDDSVLYIFEGDYGRQGKLSLDKASGKVTLVEEMYGDEKRRFFSRAAHKVERGCAGGVFPDLLEWAS